MLLTTAYCPPAAYFALLARDFSFRDGQVIPSTVWLEACENYQKQSYRNRCYIASASGVEMLQVPVVHGPSAAIKDVRIDWSTPWLVRTQRALDAAYLTSAFYEYYRDELFAVMERRPSLLWDWNLALLRFCIDKTGIACTLRETADYTEAGILADDYREAIHPKRPNAILQEMGLDVPYFQVFSDRNGFRPGLSVLDLLFNEGPDALRYLKRVQNV